MLDHGLQAHFAHLMGCDELEAQLAGQLVLVRVVQRSAHADLDGLGGVDQAFFQSTAEGGAVVVLLAEYLIADVGVAVKVHQGNRAVLLGNGTQLAQGDGMVATQGDGNDALVQDARDLALDGFVGGMDVAGGDGNIAVVGTLQVLQHVDAQDDVVRLDHGGNSADGLGPEPGSGTIRARRVEGNAHDGEIGIGHVSHARDAHEGAGIAEARGRKSASRLKVFRHGIPLSELSGILIIVHETSP